MGCIFIIGGARAGKSSYAQRLAADIGGKVLFVATAEAKDEDMRQRIESHRQNRPADWETLECPVKVGAAIADNIGDASVVIIDCITMLVSNILCQAVDGEAAESEALEEIDSLIGIMKAKNATYILVSNEVGLGIVPGNELARDYRDCLGRVNQLLAQYADEVYLMAAGIPLKIK